MTIIICRNTRKQKRGILNIRVRSKAAMTSSKLVVSEDRMMERAVRLAIKTQLRLGFTGAQWLGQKQSYYTKDKSNHLFRKRIFGNKPEILRPHFDHRIVEKSNNIYNVENIEVITKGLLPYIVGVITKSSSGSRINFGAVAI